MKYLRLDDLPSKRAIFQNIKTSNFVISIDCSICFCSSRIHKQRSLIFYKISTYIISDRSFDFGDLPSFRKHFYYFERSVSVTHLKVIDL